MNVQTKQQMDVNINVLIKWEVIDANVIMVINCKQMLEAVKVMLKIMFKFSFEIFLSS